MRKIIDISGQTFGRLTVLRFSHINPVLPRGAVFECACTCGNKLNVSSNALRTDRTQSCGCLQEDRARASHLKHGHSSYKGKRSPEYRCWSHIKSRCYNPHVPCYENYGGRGIKVCERWLHSFENFLADMGTRPASMNRIDRIDNNGDYTPENCRWAVKNIQANNKRSNKKLIFNGETLTLTQWAKRHNQKASMVSKRLKRGWSIERTLMTPPETTRHKRFIK